MSTKSPKSVIRECDRIIEGKLVLTPEQFQRWAIVQIKKLAQQSAARHLEVAQVRNKARATERFVKGGL